MIVILYFLLLSEYQEQNYVYNFGNFMDSIDSMDSMDFTHAVFFLYFRKISI